MKIQKLIVGLGNPGHNYVRTRHNAGFLLLDLLVERFDAKPSRDHSDYLLWTAEHAACRLFLMKPLTYMNLSGRALISFLSEVPIDLDCILVAYDDVALPLGTIRVKPSGSAGGQKGMKHIIETLESRELPRLRIGIGTEDTATYPLVDWVLGNFEENELPLIANALDRAADACLGWLEADVESLMARFNSKTPLSAETKTQIPGFPYMEEKIE